MTSDQRLALDATTAELDGDRTLAELVTGLVVDPADVRSQGERWTANIKLARIRDGELQGSSTELRAIAMIREAELRRLYAERAGLIDRQFAGATSRIAPSQQLAAVNTRIAQLWREKGLATDSDLACDGCGEADPARCECDGVMEAQIAADPKWQRQVEEGR